MSNVIKGSVSGTGLLKGNVSGLLARDGDSAYEIALKNGFEGTEEEWLVSLKGERGEKGEKGADGTMSFEDLTDEQRETLRGEDGKDGKDGKDGEPGKDGASITVASVSESAVDGGTNVVTFSDGKAVNIKNGSKGDKGEQGVSGVYVGSGDMPEGYNVQIDPSGEAFAPEDFGSVEVDATLTQSGKAADAKAVGDKLAEQNNKIDTLTRGVVNNRFIGKNANFLGDSQTDDAGNYKSVFFFDWLKNVLGLNNTNNYGYSGTTIMPIAGQTISFLERYTSMTDDADLIVVWGGINDYHYGHALGEVNDTVNTTFCGALNNLCKGLITKYPQKDILFVTPTPRENIASAVATQEEYADAIIAVCAKYCIPVFDAFRKCNMPIAVDYNRKYTVDGLHLNDLGHEILGKSMANFILYSEMAGAQAEFGAGQTEPDEPEVPDVPAAITGITATYTGGDVTVGTEVNGLSNITVTAKYSDGSTKNVTGYTLSGEITEGDNTITVTYEGFTTTFTVRGVADSSGDTTAPASPVDGKTVTFTAQASYPSCSNFVLLVDADEFGGTYNDEYVVTMKFSEYTSGLTGYTRGMDVFPDETGEVSNGAYKTPALVSHITTVVEGNTLTATFNRNASVNTYPYAKISLPIAMGEYPISFKVDSLTITRNGEYIPILKVGSFYEPEGFSVTD